MRTLHLFLLCWCLLASYTLYAESGCADRKCVGVKVEQVELGAGGPLIQTSGVEENLSCDAFYEQLSIRMLDDTSKKQEALLMLAMEFDLTVDITLKEQRPNTYNTCEIESVTVYSKENSS